MTQEKNKRPLPPALAVARAHPILGFTLIGVVAAVAMRERLAHLLQEVGLPASAETTAGVLIVMGAGAVVGFAAGLVAKLMLPAPTKEQIEAVRVTPARVAFWLHVGLIGGSLLSLSYGWNNSSRIQIITSAMILGATVIHAAVRRWRPKS